MGEGNSISEGLEVRRHGMNGSGILLVSRAGALEDKRGRAVLVNEADTHLGGS